MGRFDNYEVLSFIRKMIDKKKAELGYEELQKKCIKDYIAKHKKLIEKYETAGKALRKVGFRTDEEVPPLGEYGNRTDIDLIYLRDPKICEMAKKFSELEETIEMVMMTGGSKVLERVVEIIKGFEV